VSEGYSLAMGARYLKRTIDNLIKLPITMQWNNGSHFRIRVATQRIVVDAVSMRLAAA